MIEIDERVAQNAIAFLERVTANGVVESKALAITYDHIAEALEKQNGELETGESDDANSN